MTNAQAHHFGLPAHLALSSVITNSATVAGFGHRLGHLRLNYDADVVLWDSHPLSLGATPTQVFIDGVQQIARPHAAKALSTSTEAPKVASVPTHLLFDEADDGSDEIEDVVVDEVLFTGVKEVLLAREGKVVDAGADREQIQGKEYEVLVREGKIECIGSCATAAREGARKMDLKGGSLLPAMTAFGPALGLTEMISVSSRSQFLRHN